MPIERAAPLAAMLALAACAHPAPLPGMPSRADLEGALRPLDLCAGEDSGTCHHAPEPDRIRVIASRCAPLPPREGQRTVACRVTFRYIFDRVPRASRTFTGQCAVLVEKSLPPTLPFYWSIQWFEKDDACAPLGS